MINHKELLQKFTRRLGIPESEGRSSLEIFAKLISQKLELGDEVEIEALGYFTYKKVKPVNSENDEYQKIILYSEEKVTAQNKNFLLFFLPSESSREFPHIDSYLNLSFGKPLISLEKIAENEFVLPSSNNEMISLIESKVEKLFSEGMIHKSTDINDQEFILPSDEEEILFDTAAQNEPVIITDNPEFEPVPNSPIISDETKVISTFDDFKLVEPDKISSLEETNSENEHEAKWVFDDLAIQDDTDLQNEKESAPTFDGYSEVKDPFLEKTSRPDSLSGKDVSGKSFDDDLGSSPKKSTMRKLVPVLIAIFTVVLVAGIYLNYDKIKNIIFKNESNFSPTVANQKKIEPNIIARTFKIPVTYLYKLEEEELSQIQDSLIISPSVFITKQTLPTDAVSNTELVPTSDIQLVKAHQNIYQRGSEYLVQVSSWKSKSKAESELNKYIENGFRAELIEEYSSELGKYRRLMVGGFSSIDEANNFLNKNK